MHKKRSNMPKNWPVKRKGETYFSPSSHASSKSLPIVFALRDVLKIVNTNKEVRLMCINKEIKVNNKIRTHERFPLQLFDILTLDKINKNYILENKGKRIILTEISSKDSDKKIVKIIGKVCLKNKKIQMNLDDGSNYLFDKAFSLGDSAIINLKNNKIETVIPLKIGCKVRVILGKNSGKIGTLKEIDSNKKIADYIIKFEDGEKALKKEAVLAIE